jgi:tetratricopeptide (TPR) repeat protein
VPPGLRARPAGCRRDTDRYGTSSTQPACLQVLQPGTALHRDRAFPLLQEAIDSGHPEQAPHGLFVLGGLREEQADLEAAANAYERAAEYSRSWYAAGALVRLGELCLEQGKLKAAAATFRRVSERPEDHWATNTAKFRLYEIEER